MFQLTKVLNQSVNKNVLKTIICSISTSKEHFVNVGILGVPFKMGQPKSGVEEGPTVLKAGLNGVLDKIPGVSNIKDYGDVSYSPLNLEADVEDVLKCRNIGHIGPANKALSDAVQTIITEKRMAVVLGGDHAIAIGSIHGHATAVGKGNIAVLWVDAHADINTPSSSGSGNVHGMPLSLLVEETRSMWPEKIPGLEWQNPSIKVTDLAYIGIRDVDKWEKKTINDLGICAFDMQDVRTLGIDEVIRLAIEKIDPEGKKSIHVSFDIDAIDALEAPSTGTPVPGGLELQQGILIMKKAFATGRLDVVDLVEVNPKLGSPEDAEKTQAAAVDIILAACGKK